MEADRREVGQRDQATNPRPATCLPSRTRMPFVRETARVGGKEIIVETGKWAKQAGGSVVIRCGDSMVLVTAGGSAQPRDIDFMPLPGESGETFYSSGKTPGSFSRREGRTT